MIKNYIKAWKKATDYKGRASRSEYWHFILVHILIFFVVGFLEGFFSVVLGFGESNNFEGSILAVLYVYATLLPVTCLSIRRVHDSNKSFGYIFIPFYSLYLCIKKGTTGPNKYGPDPLDSGVTQ